MNGRVASSILSILFIHVESATPFYIPVAPACYPV
jgi:hypothetical protein